MDAAEQAAAAAKKGQALVEQALREAKTQAATEVETARQEAANALSLRDAADAAREMMVETLAARTGASAGAQDRRTGGARAQASRARQSAAASVTAERTAARRAAGSRDRAHGCRSKW